MSSDNIRPRENSKSKSYAHDKQPARSMPNAYELAQVIETLAPAISQGRRLTAKLVSGQHRSFFTARNCEVIYVPYPVIGGENALRTVSCGMALQASPSKEVLAALPLYELNSTEKSALSIVEGEIALAWAIEHWPGLAPDLIHLLPGFTPNKVEVIDGKELVQAALNRLKTKGKSFEVPEILGVLPIDERARRSISSRFRAQSRMPIALQKSQPVKKMFAIPIGGTGGAKSSNLQPPPSENDDPEVQEQRRVGIPYDEWNVHTQSYRKAHVSVIEKKIPASTEPLASPSPEILRYFRLSPTKTWRKRLEDGTDLDVESFVDQYCAQVAGDEFRSKVYMQLSPGARDVATAILLDGSSSLGADANVHLMLELACADALATALANAQERHAVFVFTGRTRHNVQINVLKNFYEPRAILPGKTGVQAAGYTRLGAPIRHLTRRLLEVPAERRILISIGDGLPSDIGYEGRYAFADVKKAVEEADNAGVLVYHIGVGRVRMDPLKQCFGIQKSRRITSIRELPKVLSQVHMGLCEQ